MMRRRSLTERFPGASVGALADATAAEDRERRERGRRLFRDCPVGCGVTIHRFDGDVLALDDLMYEHIRVRHPYPAVPRPSGRHPFTFAEWAALVVIAASVGFLAGVGLALVLG